MTQRYDREFKMNSVNLYNSNDKSIEEIARDLGVSRASLGKWVQQYKTNGQNSFPGSGKSVNQELHDLRRELHMVRQEREILKKAVAIFSEARSRSTNS